MEICAEKVKVGQKNFEKKLTLAGWMSFTASAG
jgi:hypothetical protein